MRVFIAGIMQGSRLDRYIDEQDYRRVIAQAVLGRYPAWEIVDPNESFGIRSVYLNNYQAILLCPQH